ncbi:MAG TPA: metallophosphoesterase [Methylomirabilota bacterium]|nr:metallophosphoesterase [Methylomirabilota bacterium]
MLNWFFVAWGDFAVNWGWLLTRSIVILTLLVLLFLSQRFWYRALWRWTAGFRSVVVRVALRLVYLSAIIMVIASVAEGLIRIGRARYLPRATSITSLAALWLLSALFAYLAVRLTHAVDRGWHWLRARSRARRLAQRQQVPGATPERLADPSRRYLFKTATALAGATPFLGAVYGFAAERLKYQVRRVELPIPNLPPALDGLRIAQLSDIHLNGYMTREQVRRAVAMANEFAPDLAVVTGDFITSAGDPLADCVEELRCLDAPLGIWGCNGNHEVYARAEEAAQRLFAQAGMKLLRQQNVQLVWRGAAFNLIGVDYQRERTPGGHRVQMLPDVATLVRRDVPNILLSHNPNSFNRAAELGIELSLAGHTHGGQIQVEILDHRFSPARFMTDYIAGLFRRPMFASSRLTPAAAQGSSSVHAPQPASLLYVNRGLGTVGPPVRLGVPPEISHLVLRRA